MKTLITQLILILFCGTLFAQNPSGKENIPTSNADFEKEMMSLINAFRKKHSLGALEWNESLAKAARYHAKDMFEDKYFEHESYDRVGGKLKKTYNTFDRVKRFMDAGLFANSENIGSGYDTPEEMLKSWLNSPGHRKNILLPNTKYIGVGYIYAEDDEFGHYWVMDTALKVTKK
jgi:uncharacterized protein YkwD